MNFSQVDAVMGQKDGQYAKKVSMKGLVDSPNAVQYSKDKGKPTQQVYITDGPGIRQRVKIVGNFPDLTQINLGQMLDFELWAYIADYDKKKYYMGFCNIPDDRQGPATEPTKDTRYDYKPHNAQPAAQPTPAAQTPQRTTQAPTPPPRDYDKENRGKCRFGFYQAAIQSGMSPTSLVKDKAGLDAIEQLVEYSMNGPNTGDQFAKDYNLPTMEEEAAQDTQNQQPPF